MEEEGERGDRMEEEGEGGERATTTEAWDICIFF